VASRWHPANQVEPSAPLLDEVFGSVGAPVLRAVREAHAAYQTLGARHALIGDLAMIFHGQPRDEVDVAFLVGHEAFETRGLVVSFRAGVPLAVADVAVDSIVAPPPFRAVLDEALDGALAIEGIPVVTAEHLVFMKLISTSRSDLADVEALVRSGRVDVSRARRLFGATSLAAATLESIARGMSVDA
jgi:hypothetical protein